MDTFNYTLIPVEQCRQIRGLWRKLNAHHLEKSPHFKEYYRQFTFEARMEKLLSPGRELRIEMAAEAATGADAGFCVASMLPSGEGEIDSIFVDAPFRRMKVASMLMRRALDWMDGAGCTSKFVTVIAGNEEAFPFYRAFGFYHATNLLRQKRS